MRWHTGERLTMEEAKPPQDELQSAPVVIGCSAGAYKGTA
jgi:hypothetical protein